mgnify:FL=1
MMQDIGYVVTITIGKCLGAITGGSRGSESSDEEFYSSGGIWEIVSSDVQLDCATEIITAQF